MRECSERTKRIGTAGGDIRHRFPRRASGVRPAVAVSWFDSNASGSVTPAASRRVRASGARCAAAAAAFSGFCTGSRVSGDVVPASGIVSGVGECSSSRTGPNEAPEKRCYGSTLGPSLQAPTP